eukprot:Skav219846  [mRNA]  locus=scaffold859:507979:508221:+ [translate_table: standard]
MFLIQVMIQPVLKGLRNAFSGGIGHSMIRAVQLFRCDDRLLFRDLLLIRICMSSHQGHPAAIVRHQILLGCSHHRQRLLQ